MAVHLATLDGKDHRRAVAEANQLGVLQIFREMYIEPGFGDQTVFQDAVHIFFPGSVVQKLRRFALGQLHVHRDGVALVCADFCLAMVKGIALLVVCTDDLLQYLIGHTVAADQKEHHFFTLIVHLGCSFSSLFGNENATDELKSSIALCSQYGNKCRCIAAGRLILFAFAIILIESLCVLRKSGVSRGGRYPDAIFIYFTNC